MHVLINRTAAMPGTAGHVHLVETAAALNRIGADARFTVALTPRQASFATQLPANFSVELLPVSSTGFARTIALQRSLRALLGRLRPDVFFNTGNSFLFGTGCRQACFVENSNVFSHPSIEWRAPDRIRNMLLRQLTRAAFRFADHVVVPTVDSAARFAERATITTPVAVAGYGWRPEAPSDERLPDEMTPPFIMNVSSVYPHKNLPRFIRAFRQLVDRHGYAGSAVIVGFAGPAPYRAEVDSAIADTQLRDRVRLLPAMPMAALVAAYAKTDAVVNPSLEETFGIPAVEAMGYGRPLAVADTSLSGRGAFFNPFRELCGDAAVYFDPFDERGMADAMAEALDPVKALPRVAAGRQRALARSWDAVARSLWDVFRAIATRS